MFEPDAVMHQTWTTLFDIRMAGGLAPLDLDHVEFMFIFLVVLFVAIVIWLAAQESFVDKVQWNKLLAFPIIAIVLLCYFALDYLDRRGAIHDLSTGNLKIAQGCIVDFETHSGEPHAARDSFPDESWSIHGERFAYKEVSDRPGYNKMQSDGGVVHQGQYLRVSYLVTSIFRRKEIMKIEADSQSCPSA